VRILHIVPDSVIAPKHRFLGSTKDIRGRTEYFRYRGFDSEEIVVFNRKDSVLKRILAGRDLSKFDAIFIELPIYPATIRYLRQNHSELRIFVRSINAEFYHDWHYVLSGLKYGYWRKALLYSLFAWRRLYWDYVCAYNSDKLFCITEWERKYYWSYLIGKKKPVTLPYFLPSEYIFDNMDTSKSDKCICLLSTIENSFLADAAENFIGAVRGLGGDLPTWDFYLTGANSLMPNEPVARLNATGLLDSPYEILAKSRAMAILSDYGFGFKTKILDAILHKCFVLMTPGLYKRLPALLLPFCLSVDPADSDAFKSALQSCLKPFPEVDANAILRAQVFEALDYAFDIPRS
jgi:hypothetical protein